MSEILKQLFIPGLEIARDYAAHYGKAVWFVVTVLLFVWWLI